jgi:O-6-methylguanine DNA methyltransferase
MNEFSEFNYGTFKYKEDTYVLAKTEKGLAFVGNNFSQLETFFPHTAVFEDTEDLQPFWNQIREYLSNDRKNFTFKLDIPGTKFQESVWNELRKIPYGETRSYTEIAQAIKPKSVRAVGSAVAKNPVLIVVPCHRVITKSHKLGNYRGGLTMKRDLLTLEGAID